jgi:predicted SprT family Zn-dependent metalloprotease
MSTRPDIKAMFVRLNNEHFSDEIPDLPVVWNTRMTTTAGYCRYRRFTPSHPEGSWAARNRIEPYKIDLSDQLFRKMDYDVDKIERTLIHEMVHAYLIHKYNEKGHTARFQRLMRNITGEYKNHRCHNYDTTGLRRKQAKNVVWQCQGSCGASGRKVRMPKRGRTYVCRTCGGRVRFTRDIVINRDSSKIDIF